MIRVGFTGTQKGMTEFQKEKFNYHIQRIKPDEFHHGDCIGADEEAHNIVRKVLPDCRIVIHPPLNPSKRAWCVGDVYHTEREYKERNYDIVEYSDVLIATPEQPDEILRSGTWMTIRYARKWKVRDIIIIGPV